MEIMSRSKRYGLLTERQYQVLKLRAQGLKQVEIAKILGTSRENISVIEKSAMRKIRLAEDTLRIYRELFRVDQIIIEPDTYTLDIPRIVFRRADELGIRLRANVSFLLGMIHYNARDCVRNRRVIKAIAVAIYRDGGIDVSCE